MVSMVQVQKRGLYHDIQQHILYYTVQLMGEKERKSRHHGMLRTDVNVQENRNDKERFSVLPSPNILSSISVES